MTTDHEYRQIPYVGGGSDDSVVQANDQWLDENEPGFIGYDGDVDGVPVRSRRYGWGMEARTDLMDCHWSEVQDRVDAWVTDAGGDPDDDSYAWVEVVEAVRGLDNYPLIDEGLHSEITNEREQEAWTDRVNDIR